MKKQVMHIIQWLSRGGAARSMAATARYSDEFRHTVVSLLAPEPEAIEMVEQSGMEFLPTSGLEEVQSLCSQADIVQVEWWNSPEMDAFLRLPLPAMRLLIWFHVSGDRDPQYITRGVVDYADLAVGSSPQCYESPGIMSLPTETRMKKAGLVYDATDFARLGGFAPRPHPGFNVGYIGTVHFCKMHRDFVSMSAHVEVPNIRFVVCGGGIEDQLRREAEALGASSKFDFKGYVEDIKAEIEQFDVYGYPLCEDTYASAELNLQEVMFGGITPVVFPYGGVKQLVFDNYTGLVVRSPAEYTQAIEYLYREPEERNRMGRNAREYALQIFGGQNAAKEFIRLYNRILDRPKTSRKWGVDREKPLLHRELNLADIGVSVATELSGAERFLESLGEESNRQAFQISRTREDFESLIAAESQITSFSPLMGSSIDQYAKLYQQDPFLRLWSGLAAYGQDQFERAAVEFVASLQLGLSRASTFWYLSQTAYRIENMQLAAETAQVVTSHVPGFQPAQQFLAAVVERKPLSKASSIDEVQFA